MGYGFWDGVADVLTGGGYSLTKGTADTLAGALGGTKDSGVSSGGTGGQIAPAGQGGSGTGYGQGGQASPSLSKKCCCWEISGDYLLNGETGQVWFISKEKMELLPLKRSLPPMESAARAVNIVAMKHAMLEQKDTVIANMPFAARESMTGKVNALIKAFDKEIGK